MKKLFLTLLLILSYSLSEAIQLDLLTKKIAGPTPEWMNHQIHKDLQRFEKHGFTQQDLDETLELFVDDSLTMRCKIINHKIYFSYFQGGPIIPNARINAVFYVLQFLSKHYRLPNVEFILSFQDTIHHEASSLKAPVFTFAKNKYNNALIAFPDAEALHGYTHTIQKVTVANSLYPFEEKLSKAFWRGSATGGLYTLSNWQHYPRSQLVLFSKKHPGLLDARFTSIIQTPSHENLSVIFKEQDMMGESVPIDQHIPFKYLVDVDGNSCSYSRLVWILFSNCLCLKQVSDNEQWYYSGLKPYVHYVPFNSDMSDFAEKITWAEAHPQEVKRIIHNANTFVTNNLQQEDIFHYVYRLLMAYAQVQRFIPER